MIPPPNPSYVRRLIDALIAIDAEICPDAPLAPVSIALNPEVVVERVRNAVDEHDILRSIVAEYRAAATSTGGRHA